MANQSISFKVGDRVRRTFRNAMPSVVPANTLGTVCEIKLSEKYGIVVDWDELPSQPFICSYTLQEIEDGLLEFYGSTYSNDWEDSLELI